MFSVPEYFVFARRQHIPLTGCAELTPGDFIGVLSAFWLRVAVKDLEKVAVPPGLASAPAVYTVPDEKSQGLKCEPPCVIFSERKTPSRGTCVISVSISKGRLGPVGHRDNGWVFSRVFRHVFGAINRPRVVLAASFSQQSRGGHSDDSI